MADQTNQPGDGQAADPANTSTPRATKRAAQDPAPADVTAQNAAATAASVEEATRVAEEEASRLLQEARDRDAETLRQQESMEPFPSQEEADRVKANTATPGAATYQTRDMKG